MFNNSQSNCPACEYKSGKPGKAVRQQDGRTICLDCGNSWKEFGNLVPRIAEPAGKGSQGQQQIARTSRKWLPKKDNSVSSGLSYPSGFSSAQTGMEKPYSVLVTTIACCCGFVLLAAAAGWIAIGMSQTPAKTDHLHAGEIRYEEFARAGNSKAVRVTGRITNNKKQAALVGQIEIILRGPGGREITRWQHSPSPTALQPGEAIRFVSAVPVREGKISSVEVRPL